MYKKCEEILNKLESEGKIKISDYQFPPKQELKLKLEDIIKLDYSNPIIRYEAELGNPNNTASRKKILDSSFKRYENGKISNESIPTITTKQDRFPNSGVIEYEPVDKSKSKFRYLTPRECFLLMGFDDADFEKASQVNSNAQLYKQAGNSIVVPVLESILKEIIKGEIKDEC